MPSDSKNLNMESVVGVIKQLGFFNSKVGISDIYEPVPYL